MGCNASPDSVMTVSRLGSGAFEREVALAFSAFLSAFVAVFGGREIVPGGAGFAALLVERGGARRLGSLRPFIDKGGLPFVSTSVIVTLQNSQRTRISGPIASKSLKDIAHASFGPVQRFSEQL